MADTVVQPNNQTVRFQGKPTTEAPAPPAKKKPAVSGAKSRAKEMLKKGHISEKEYGKIAAKADAVGDAD